MILNGEREKVLTSHSSIMIVIDLVMQTHNNTITQYAIPLMAKNRLFITIHHYRIDQFAT